MSNHYHLVLHVDRSAADAWTLNEVVARWTILFSKPRIIERWEQGIALDVEMRGRGATDCALTSSPVRCELVHALPQRTSREASGWTAGDFAARMNVTDCGSRLTS
jgi:hypothetical protein